MGGVHILEILKLFLAVIPRAFSKILVDKLNQQNNIIRFAKLRISNLTKEGAADGIQDLGVSGASGEPEFLCFITLKSKFFDKTVRLKNLRKKSY